MDGLLKKRPLLCVYVCTYVCVRKQKLAQNTLILNEIGYGLLESASNKCRDKYINLAQDIFKLTARQCCNEILEKISYSICELATYVMLSEYTN